MPKETATKRWAGWCPTTGCARQPTRSPSACPAVRVQCDTRVTGLRRLRQRRTLEVEGGPALQAPLVVAADSRFSSLRRMAGIGARMLDFGRTAIVCRVGHEKDHEGIALECFRYGNTLAVLPMAGRLASAVVTLPSDQAPDWLALDATTFATRVQQQLDSRLGAMRLAGERHSYPLVGVYAHRFAAPRFALVGDAAVGMHPVTAHGYNFGLYGVEVLARELARARHLGRDLGDLAALLAYEREHRRVTLADLPGHQCHRAALHRRPRAGPPAARHGAGRGTAALAPARRDRAPIDRRCGTTRPCRQAPRGAALNPGLY
jgi:ubiquinone biosynthesis UbiH/UbiF/VisC/COQ6 family hydroxylase